MGLSQSAISGSRRGVFCIVGLSLTRYSLFVSHFFIRLFDRYDEIAFKMLCVLITFFPNKSIIKLKSKCVDKKFSILPTSP